MDYYPQFSIFPAHLPEENIVQGGAQDRDIRELLPADPFGMDISSTMTKLTEWLEDLGVEYGGDGGCGGGGEVGVGVGVGYDYTLFAGWNFWWNAAAMEWQALPGNMKFDDSSILNDTWVDSLFPKEEEEEEEEEEEKKDEEAEGFRGSVYNGDAGSTGSFDSSFYDHWKFPGVDGCFPKAEFGHLVYDRSVGFACAFEGAKFGCFNSVVNAPGKGTGVDDDDTEWSHHPALSFALAYLGVRDLLSVERVCKSLCYTVRNDPLLWRNIHIDSPMSDRLTDNILLKLTERAQGSLHSLSLVGCQKVTDDCLKRILDGNPRFTKLSVPGCTRLSIDGVVNSLKAFKTVAVNGIKCLRVGGLYGVTQKHYEELIHLLGIHSQVKVNCDKPPLYHRGRKCYLSYDDDRPIDIEMCPRCQNFRLVYDCPAEGCQGNDHGIELCRGCTLCIPRCCECGKCVNDGEYEETFCLEIVCSDCWKQYYLTILSSFYGVFYFKKPN